MNSNLIFIVRSSKVALCGIQRMLGLEGPSDMDSVEAVKYRKEQQ